MLCTDTFVHLAFESFFLVALDRPLLFFSDLISFSLSFEMKCGTFLFFGSVWYSIDAGENEDRPD